MAAHQPSGSIRRHVSGLALCGLASAAARGQSANEVNEQTVLHRPRNEQRWQQEVEDDILTGENKFSDRVRNLVSLSIHDPAGNEE
jgi:hypothetical protein